MMHRLSQVQNTEVYVEALPQDLELFLKNSSPNGKNAARAGKTTVGGRIYRELGKGAGT